MNKLSLHDGEDYNKIIPELWKKDSELLDKWHITAGMGHDYCINKTLNDIKGFDKSFKFYTIKDSACNVGFFGIEFENFLTTLYMSPDYRKKEYIGQFWNMILNNINKPFKSAIYAKNKPCADFFVKNGGILIDIGRNLNNTFIVFEFKGAK